uniref:Uncharacterized protein n=1 Tax=Romanomermis culicivorax TaxID=13658 RepID=A0A915K476_ROMCU
MSTVLNLHTFLPVALRQVIARLRFKHFEKTEYGSSVPQRNILEMAPIKYVFAYYYASCHSHLYPADGFLEYSDFIKSDENNHHSIWSKLLRSSLSILQETELFF